MDPYTRYTIGLVAAFALPCLVIGLHIVVMMIEDWIDERQED